MGCIVGGEGFILLVLLDGMWLRRRGERYRIIRSGMEGLYASQRSPWRLEDLERMEA